jgi:hypothetical protein
MAKIEIWECCPDRSVIEYWHEHRNCGDPMCYAEECEYCGKWKTLCGMFE